MKTNRTEYLFSVNTHAPPTMAVDPGEEFTVQVRGAFDDVEDISAVPTPFTPACDGHPLAPMAGPIVVRGAKPGDVVAINLIELTPFGTGKSAILRDFGVLRRKFPDPMALSSPVRDGRAWFGDRIPVPLSPNLGTISTMPPEGYKPSYAGAYGGDFDQRDAGQGSRVFLPVLVEDALVFFGDPHAAISEDAARRAIDFTIARTGLSREEAYMLLSIIGELRVGTSPRPVMATRLIVPEEQLRAAGWDGELP